MAPWADLNFQRRSDLEIPIQNGAIQWKIQQYKNAKIKLWPDLPESVDSRFYGNNISERKEQQKSELLTHRKGAQFLLRWCLIFGDEIDESGTSERNYWLDWKDSESIVGQTSNIRQRENRYAKE